ncbi:MAG: GSCFA domain-containing protein [Bacteroidales bacterium]|jgi:hypothetical protein|nr:GSCFA domain-containing protein [Bacteroidales bacterium]
MEFRTIVDLPVYPFSISHENRLLLCGSCFAENIGKRLLDSRFNVNVNPFGILYNPLSIKAVLDIALDGKQFTEKDLFFHKGMYHNFLFHSRFSSDNAADCLQNMNGALSNSCLKQTDILMLTFGTAYVYLLRETGKVVSNCHKLPDRLFVRQRLTVDEIVDAYTELFSRLLMENNQLKILLSVSPIRHWKDGAHENQLSKSILLLAIEALQRRFHSIVYFPSFEIVLDELRDYRFFADDMNHISNLAVSCIWERFGNAFFDEKTFQIIRRWEKIKQALQHRPLNPHSNEYKMFVDKTAIELQQFENEYLNKR